MIRTHFPRLVVRQTTDLKALLVEVDASLRVVHILIVLRQAVRFIRISLVGFREGRGRGR